MRDTSEHHESESYEPQPQGSQSQGSERQESESPDTVAEPRITLRGPAELADALPYLLGFHPTDSAVLVALHGENGRFGGRVRVGLPASPQEWPDIAAQLADCLVTGSERRGTRPDGIVVFLCQDPSADGTGRDVMERLRPLAQRLRTACGSLDVPVLEALCISDGRYWSYCCPDTRCCPLEGNVLALPGTSVMAAAATYAGIQVRGSLREMEERLSPWRTGAVAEQERALDAAAGQLFPRILSEGGRRGVADETLDLAARLMRRIADAPPPPARGTGSSPTGGRGTTLLLGRNAADDLDDGLIAHDEAAAVILGVQDRTTRDWAAEWMEGPDAQPALRLWRALARRCVGPYGEHAAALLTLAGWVSWSTGDDPNARVALSMAMRADPDYRFADLLHRACNQGLDPEELRICLRQERAARLACVAAAFGDEGEPLEVAETLEGAVSEESASRMSSSGVSEEEPEGSAEASEMGSQAVELPEPTRGVEPAEPTMPQKPSVPPEPAARRAPRAKPRREPASSAGDRPNGRMEKGSSARREPTRPKSDKVRERTRRRAGVRVQREKGGRGD
ncbi:DUF4192 domain-containing protein [Streptomyces sp. NPDC059928]|uniref:DUF4192 domain-containing protein n=1 Tax=unclassified Streptomyces TaxID=2593676 RepID=UPI00364FF463